MSNDGAYAPLKEWEFRVLILKDDGKDGFICGLKTLSIDTNLGYVALSYTWGDATDTGSVRTCECCDRRVTTRQNLINALRQLHKLDYRLVWADALCINQNDLAERASQVKMMRHIYEKAQRVFIWLSPVSERISVPKPLLNLLCTLDTTPNNMAKAASAVEKDPASVAFLADILKCDYWKRAWIIQEIAVGLRVGMLLADHIVPWENLLLLIHPAVTPITAPTVAPISRLGLKLLTDPDADRGLTRLLRLDKIRNRKGASLITMLGLCAGAQQREDNDAIFSKLGLASDTQQLLPNPDYSKSCRQVHIELALNYIRTKKSINILCAVNHHVATEDPADDGLEDLHLPTWTPDWRRESSFHALNIVTVASYALLFRAGLEAEFHLPKNYLEHDEKLTVHGFSFDTCRAASVNTPASQPGRKYGGASVPFEIVETFLRTACADHLLSNDWLIAQSVPTRDLELLIILLQKYYAPPASFIEKLSFKTFLIWINEIGVMSDRTRKDFEMLMDYWSTFSLKGRRFIDWVLACSHGEDGNELWFCVSAKEQQSLSRLIHSMVVSSRLFNRKLMESEKIGIVHVPLNTMPGDEICVIRGCDLPMVLRKVEGSEYRVIGGCYCYPIMYGAAMKDHLNEQMELDDFTLI